MSFPLAGNGKIKIAVTNALKEKRLPHAILIEGDKGTGRHTLANYLAMAMVCSGENIPCKACKNCLMKSNHPDITVTRPEDGKKNIAVSQIRLLKTEAYIKPHQAEKRVFIIDFADTLNEQSQNALLKVLEEPPVSTAFILIAESKASLLDTVLSRCVLLSLTAPEFNESLEYLKANTDFSEEDIASALESAQNNIGEALAVLSGESDSKTVAGAKEFIEHFLRGNSFGMLSATAPFEKNRIEAENFFKDLKYFTVKTITKNTKITESKALSSLYTLLSELEKSLITNINLTLLFCTLVSRAENIKKY